MAVAKALLLVVVLMAVVGTWYGVEGALSCGQVQGTLAQCMNYLKKGGAVPPACCAGVKNLNNMAKTTPDRQQACKCLKSAYSGIPGIQPGLAAGLPGNCGVNVPYKISPNTDCSKVQ